MNTILAWLLVTGLFAGTVLLAIYRRWLPAILYAVVAISSFVFVLFGGALDLLLNALTLMLLMLIPGIVLLTARGQKIATNSFHLAGGGKPLGVLLILLASVGLVGLVLSSLP